MSGVLVSFLPFPGDTGDDQWESDKGDWVPLLYVPAFTWRWPLILYSLASHLWIYRNWKPNDIHCYPAGCGLAHPHVFLHPCPLFPGDLVYHNHHPQDALLPSQWAEDHLSCWLPSADVLLPLTWHHRRLCPDSNGHRQVHSYLQPPPLPNHYDSQTLYLSGSWILPLCGFSCFMMQAGFFLTLYYQDSCPCFLWSQVLMRLESRTEEA